MNDRAWLERAADHVFIAGVGDLGEALCRANVTFGIAKVHAVQRALGRQPDAFFLGAPDATITRNPRRWRQGFGYGGLFRVPDDLAILDGKPNACGMLVGALDTAADEQAVRSASAAARTEALELDGVPLAYDLHESNHFVDALELDQRLVDDPTLDLPEQLFIIHSSGHEHRVRSPFGPGLYIDESPELAAVAQRHQTPWGELSVLEGDLAQAYYAFCERVQRFNHERRELYGERLFGSFDTLCNATHQGFRRPGEHYLGAYFFDDERQLYPLTLGPDQPVYLLRPRKNLTPETLDELGWSERARDLGLWDELRRANVLPHGGGYALDGELRGVSGSGDDRRFLIDPGDGNPAFSLAEIREIPFGYRDDRVLSRAQELRLAEPVARYRIRFVVK